MKAIISPNIRIRVPEHFLIGENSIVDDFSYFSTKIKVGKFSHIASGCSVAGGKDMLFTLGDFCSLSSGVKIWCGTNDFVNDLIILDLGIDIGANICKGNVSIGNYCGIGTNAVIMPNNDIPEGVAIGGLSWTPANYKFEPWTVYAGIPIKKIKNRNKNNIMNQVRKIENEFK